MSCVGEERDTNKGWDDTAAETLVAGGGVVVDQVDERLHELQEERRGVVRVVGAPRLERLEDERDDAVPARAARDQLLVLLVQVRRLLDQLQQRPEEMPLLSCHHLLTRGAEKACCEVKRGKKRKRWGKEAAQTG